MSDEGATRDFDAERTATNGSAPKPKTFTLGGYKFTLRPRVRPEVMRLSSGEAMTIADTVTAYDTFVKQVIIPEDAEMWDKVRAEAEPEITLHEIEELSGWLLEQAAGRPTDAPSSRGRGRSRPAATFMEG